MSEQSNHKRLRDAGLYSLCALGCVRLAGRQECALIHALRVLTNVCVTKATISCGYIAEKIRISVECV